MKNYTPTLGGNASGGGLTIDDLIHPDCFTPADVPFILKESATTVLAGLYAFSITILEGIVQVNGTTYNLADMGLEQFSFEKQAPLGTKLQQFNVNAEKGTCIIVTQAYCDNGTDSAGNAQNLSETLQNFTASSSAQ